MACSPFSFLLSNFTSNPCAGGCDRGHSMHQLDRCTIVCVGSVYQMVMPSNSDGSIFGIGLPLTSHSKPTPPTWQCGLFQCDCCPIQYSPWQSIVRFVAARLSLSPHPLPKVRVPIAVQRLWMISSTCSRPWCFHACATSSHVLVKSQRKVCTKLHPVQDCGWWSAPIR